MSEKKKSFSKNIVYSLINSLTTLLFPVVTYPYVSRVLLPEGVGRYNLAYGVLEYFILIASLGVPLLGTRMVAKYKDDSTLLKEKCSDIFSINFITTIVSFFAFLLFAGLNPKINHNFLLYFVVSLQLLSFCFGVEWYYQGIEDFRFIAFKNLFVKIISGVLIFIFVRTSNDVIIYAMIMMFSTLGYSLINFYKFIKDTHITITFKNVKSLIKSILIVFLIYAASKINSNLDVIMLGFMTGDKGEYNVGIYTTATKIINMAVSLVTSMNVVVLPRVVSIIEDGNKQKANMVLKKMFTIIFALCLAMSIGLFFVSKEVVLVFSGEKYIDSINTMKIMCINVALSSLTNYFGVEVLYANNKEIITGVSILIGAITNIILNSILIPKYIYIGAAIATVCSNAVIFILEYAFSVKYIKCSFLSIDVLKSIFVNATMFIGLFIFGECISISNTYLSLLVKVVVGLSIFIISCGLLWLYVNIKRKESKNEFVKKD